MTKQIECAESEFDTVNPSILYRNRRDLYCLFVITKFRYKGSYINGLEGLGENVHFDIRGYFVLSEFDIEGVDCSFKFVKCKFNFVNMNIK